MNPFEKIFNYQVIGRLDDSGTFMVTAHERAWLKKMLDHPASAEAFSMDTRQKLLAILEKDPAMETADLVLEKGKSVEKQVYHPLLRSLRQYIMNRNGIRISYQVKGDRENTGHSGLPYKLEYSMIKREWYLLWFHLRHQAFMSTRLNKIIAVSSEPIHPRTVERALARISEILDSRKTEVVVEVCRGYHKELSRILYAFSCFEKTVEYDEPSNTYQIRISVFADEAEYLLSKIRFLGKRVRVLEGDYLKRRMLEASTKALERYNAVSAEEEPL